MKTLAIEYVGTVDLGDNCFAVDAKAKDGRWFRHEGPKGFPFYTDAEATRFAGGVRLTMKINTAHWIDGSGGSYGTEAHEMDLIEAEYNERA